MHPYGVRCVALHVRKGSKLAAGMAPIKRAEDIRQSVRFDIIKFPASDSLGKGRAHFVNNYKVFVSPRFSPHDVSTKR